MQFSYLHFKQPNILCTSNELSRSNFFFSGVLGVIDPRTKFDRKSSSEVHKMLGCLKCKYENCIFIREHFFSILKVDSIFFQQKWVSVQSKLATKFEIMGLCQVNGHI